MTTHVALRTPDPDPNRKPAPRPRLRASVYIAPREIREALDAWKAGGLSAPEVFS